jgi:transposase
MRRMRAICEAVRRPTMRFVPVKSADQQAAVMLHRARELLVRQRTMLVNALRGHLAEFGIVAAKGLHKVEGLIEIVRHGGDDRVPDAARQVLSVIAKLIGDVGKKIAALERQILAWHKSHAVCRRLATIPGIGPMIATAIAAAVPDPSAFRNGREFAAWLGLVPRQSSTGGKTRLGGISKRGNGYLRRLLVNGAHTALHWSKVAKADPWMISLRARKHRLVATVALANKTARIAWAVMSNGQTYRQRTVVA